jgi:hypothetical protein
MEIGREKEMKKYLLIMNKSHQPLELVQKIITIIHGLHQIFFIFRFAVNQEMTDQVTEDLLPTIATIFLMPSLLMKK